MTATDDDEMTELVDADFPRVDLVGKGANGIPRWLIAKQDGVAGLLEPGFVRELIGKQAEPERAGRERVEMSNGITLNGSPADIAAFIHKASVRQPEADPDEVAKAKLSTAELNDLPDSAFAYIEPGGKKDEHGRTTPRSLRHFAIHDKSHADNAAARIAQGAEFGDKAKAKVEAAQRKFGEKVSKETGVTAATVIKDMSPELDDGIDGLDPTVPLAEPDEMGPGDPTDPGSPAWESVDAASAQKWTSIFARGKVALGVLSEREMLEAASADPDDACNAMDLQDAMCALDYIIGILAPFAVGEQSEADCGAMEMAAIGKAAEGLLAPLATVEGLCAIAKSGRVLSAANEAHIRDAAQALNTVLSSLPKAPVTDDGQPVAKQAKQKGTTVAETETAASQDATQVAKETASAEAQAADTGPVKAGGTTGMGEPRRTGTDSALPADGPQAALPGDVADRQVIKAAGVGLFDHSRRFLGLADASAIHTDIAKADGDGKKAMCVVYNQAGKLMGIVDPDDITPVANSEAEPDEAPDAEPTAAAADLTPQPPADAGTPADTVADDGTVAKQDADVHAVLKSIIADAVSEVLGAQAPQEDVAKQADVAGLTQKVEDMLTRIAKVEEQPAAPKVFTNGQVPPAHQMRGQDQGAAPQIDVAKAAEMKRTLFSGTAAEQKAAFEEMQQMAVGRLADMHAAGRR